MEIRLIVDAADRRLAQPEIYAELKVNRPNKNLFCVTIADMWNAKQLSKRKASKRVHIATGATFVYGPGKVAVSEDPRAERPKRILGFMEEKRMREAKRLKRAA
jgi:hypothetical protein